ncbi:GIN domain-containing protein [Massilia glaciei]|uniref:DUF2807 domain-containing protein n=1 Tax=Massilia glaciei TaxID=1524097 RepID=A0A2U2HLF5_9BURK|nr:DUF2807 domain-containing protein [Massilia glaciei]PWF48340.1 DUF2807 domain-containing protein [Massilia glaciei]
MNHIIKLGLATAAMCTLFAGAPALAAPDEAVTETRVVDARVTRVKLDGVVNLRVRQGAVASLVLNGDKRWVGNTTTAQSGDTLVIEMTDTDHIRVGRNSHIGIRAELTLPALRAVSSESLGWTEVSGFSGERLSLELDGAGGMKVNCQYRIVDATLGGLGSLNIEGNNEGIDLDLQGAGFVILSGRSKWLKANVSGLGGLNAKKLEADTVDLDLGGVGGAAVTARESAKLSLGGMGSVTVYGKPAKRNVSVDGLGSVSWK